MALSTYDLTDSSAAAVTFFAAYRSFGPVSCDVYAEDAASMIRRVEPTGVGVHSRLTRRAGGLEGAARRASVAGTSPRS
jgi:hypothetical protein